MSKDTEGIADEIEFDSLSVKRRHRTITCLLDLPDEIFLLICRYLSRYYVLYSFYTPSRPELCFHRIISDYYTKIRLDKIKNNEYSYLFSLFSDSKNPLRPQSLLLSNQNIHYLTERYFTDKPTARIQSIFVNLRRLVLIDCCAKDLKSIDIPNTNMTQLEYLYIKMVKINTSPNRLQTCSIYIHELLFAEQMPSINTVYIEINDGLILKRTLMSHNRLTNINLCLQTIDDLYILLDELVPNVEILIIQLCQSRLLCM